MLALLAAMAVGVGGASGSPLAATDEVRTTTLTGASEVPPNASGATGTATVTLNGAETMITVDVSFSNLQANATGAHIHEAPPMMEGGIIFDLGPVPTTTSATIPQHSFSVTPAQVATLRAGNYYVNVHSGAFPGGEIRGQLPGTPTAVRLSSASARRTAQGVLVLWRTATETNALGFNVYRQGPAGLVRLNRTLIRSAAAGGLAGHGYFWLDRSAPKSSVRYRLQSVGLDGSRQWVASARVGQR